MPCTLCYADGHNRRTCQRWDLLEAVRREESARLDMIRNNHLDIIAAANVAIAISTANVSGLGTMATQNANAVVITGGSATLSNVTITANLYANLATSNTAAMPDPSLPLAPEGYVTIIVNGTAKKIPYYGV